MHNNLKLFTRIQSPERRDFKWSVWHACPDVGQWRSAVERSGAIAPGRQGLRGAAAAGYKIFFQFNMAAREVACLAIASLQGATETATPLAAAKGKETFCMPRLCQDFHRSVYRPTAE